MDLKQKNVKRILYLIDEGTTLMLKLRLRFLVQTYFMTEIEQEITIYIRQTVIDCNNKYMNLYQKTLLIENPESRTTLLLT